MVSVLTSIVVDHGFEHRSGQARDYEIVFATFKRTKRAVLRSKDLLVRTKDNVPEWGVMSTRVLRSELELSDSI
jgi:hypothetical protein